MIQSTDIGIKFFCQLEDEDFLHFSKEPIDNKDHLCVSIRDKSAGESGCVYLRKKQAEVLVTQLDKLLATME